MSEKDVLILAININMGGESLRLRERILDAARQQRGLSPGVSTHIWMWDGVLSLNGVSLRT